MEFKKTLQWSGCDCTNDGCTGHLHKRVCSRQARVRIVNAGRMQEDVDHSRWMCWQCATDYAQLGRIVILERRPSRLYQSILDDVRREIAEYQKKVATGEVEANPEVLVEMRYLLDRLTHDAGAL